MALLQPGEGQQRAGEEASDYALEIYLPVGLVTVVEAVAGRGDAMHRVTGCCLATLGRGQALQLAGIDATEWDWVGIDTAEEEVFVKVAAELGAEAAAGTEACDA